jgi:hypothetical protein
VRIPAVSLPGGSALLRGGPHPVLLGVRVHLAEDLDCLEETVKQGYLALQLGHFTFVPI